MAIRFAGLLLAALLVDRYVVPRVTLWWFHDAHVIFQDAFVPAVGGASAEEAAREFAFHWLSVPGRALAYVSRDHGLRIEAPEYRDPLMPEDCSLFTAYKKRENVRVVSLTPILDSDGRAQLATVLSTAFAEEWNFRFVVVQGRRGRWFVAAEDLEARTRRYNQQCNDGPWPSRNSDSSSTDSTGESELDFTKD